MGESNLYSSAIKRHICVSVDFILMEQACQWGWMELLGTGRGFKSGSCSHLLGVRLEVGWVVNPISRSAGKAGIEERLNRGRGGLLETEERGQRRTEAEGERM